MNQRGSMNGLTKREMEIYKFFGENAVKKQDVAKALSISKHTIHSHLKSIYFKLGIHSIPELIRHYYQNK